MAGKCYADDNRRGERGVEGKIMLTEDQAFPLPLKGVFVGNDQWKLWQPFIYDNPPVKITIPVGFITDGASIPKIMFIRRFIGSHWSGNYGKAAVLHDFGYFSQIRTRKEVDRIFLEGMKILGVSRWKRGTMYNAIRLFAWIHWNKRKKILVGRK